jgi:hypothetical protein
MANIPNARNYRVRIGDRLVSVGRTIQGLDPDPAAMPRGVRFAVWLVGVGLLSVFGGLKAALIGGLILGMLLYLA